MKDEYFLTDNGGVLAGPFASAELAREEAKAYYKESGTHEFKRNVKIVLVIESLDNAIYNGGFEAEIKAEIE